jgi:hypothetical protein
MAETPEDPLKVEVQEADDAPYRIAIPKPST